MQKERARKVYYCPVEVTLDKIGGKWKPLVLWYLKGKTRRFGELKRLIPNITEKMLTEKLRELEADGLVNREVYREVPPKVEYSLTRYGRSLDDLLERLCAWGRSHAKRSNIEINPSLPTASGRVAN